MSSAAVVIGALRVDLQVFFLFLSTVAQFVECLTCDQKGSGSNITVAAVLYFQRKDQAYRLKPVFVRISSHKASNLPKRDVRFILLK